jgi:hypothetical protein
MREFEVRLVFAAFLGDDWPVPGEKGERVLFGTVFLFEELE